MTWHRWGRAEAPSEQVEEQVEEQAGQPGRAVGGVIRPGTTDAQGAAAGAAAPDHHRPSGGGAPSHAGAPGALGPGSFGPGSDPAQPFVPPPGFGAPPEPQCPGGLLEPVLALIAQVIGGVAAEQALAERGARYPDAAALATMLAMLNPQTLDSEADGAVLLALTAPEGDRAEAGDDTELRVVLGLLPLLDAVRERQNADSQNADRTQDAPTGQTPLLPGGDTPQPITETPGETDGQLTELAALLGPFGFGLDPLNGSADPMLLPVLGSLGCQGFVATADPVSADAPAGARAQAPADGAAADR